MQGFSLQNAPPGVSFVNALQKRKPVKEKGYDIWTNFSIE
jgi:hypothetical protein